MERFEKGIDDIYEELETSDLYNISSEAEEKMIEEQKELILKTYNKISDIRNKFKEKYNLTI